LPNHAALHANFGSASAFLGTGKLSLGILPAFGAAMVGALFSLGGADNLLAAAAEVRNPGRSLPISLIGGACLVIVLYLLVNLAYLAQLPLLGDPASPGVFARGIAGADSGRVAAATMAMLWGSAGEVLTAILVMISTFGCINGFILGGGRLIFAMAYDRMFFPIASRLNQAAVPAFALAIQALWCSVLVLSGDFSDLLNYMGAAGALFGILSVAAVFAVRIKHPDASRPYRAWGYPYVPVFNLLGSLAILVDLVAVRPRYSLFGLLIVAAGLPVHLWLKRRIRGLAVESHGLAIALEPDARG
jgi:basic amino acid/polyamine antiporter, APA family